MLARKVYEVLRKGDSVIEVSGGDLPHFSSAARNQTSVAFKFPYGTRMFLFFSNLVA